MTDRKLIQQLFIRVCRDSRFTMDAVAAMQLTAKILNIDPLHVWLALPSISVAEEIAAGTHPACAYSERRVKP